MLSRSVGLFISLEIIIGLSPYIGMKVDYLIGVIKVIEIIILSETQNLITL